MKITFSDDAHETFQDFVRQIEGYLVRIVVNPDDENRDPNSRRFVTYDAFVRGVDNNSEWGDSVLVQKAGNVSTPIGDTFSVRVDALHVY